MKTKKLLSVLSAAAVSASAFTGLALTASAYDELPVVYAGNVDTDNTKKITTTGDFHGKETDAATVTLDDSVSDDLKNLFDNDSDGDVDAKYTSSYFNYIGTNTRNDEMVYNSVNITVDLEAGAYTMYYMANKSGTMGTVTLDEGANEVTVIGNYISLGSNGGVYPVTLILPEDYSGNICFDREGGWLPDLYSITIVASELKTENDVITASEIIRPNRSKNINDFTGNYELEEACPQIVKNVFGETLGNAGTQYLNYTTGTDGDHVYIKINKSGMYAVDILSQNNKGDSFTDLEFTSISNTEANKTIRVTDNSAGKVASNGSDPVYYHTSANNVELEAGIYKVNFKANSKTYYCNFIAMALRDVSEPEPAKTLEMTNMGKFEGTDGSVATAFTADFKSSEFEAAKAKTVTISLDEYEQEESVAATVISGGADVVYGLIVNDMDDTEKAAKAVITFE